MKSTAVARVTFLMALVLTVSRCSTVSERSEFGLRAPSAIGIGTEAEAKDPASKAAIAYRKALSDAKAGLLVESCEGFRNLALDNALPEPVRLLARVRTIPVCPADRTPVLVQPPKWLAEETARAMIVAARRDGDGLALARALRETAPFEKTQKLRVERLQESIRVHSEMRQSPDTAAEIRESTVRLISTAPRFALENDFRRTGEKAPDDLAIAFDLRSARNFNKARQFFSQVAGDKSRTALDRLKALDGLRLSYKLELKTDDFLAASSKWMAFAKTRFLKPGLKTRDAVALKTYVDTRIMYARAIWTDHRPSVANKILQETEKEVAGRAPVHESMLIRARIAEESGRFEEMHEILSGIAIDSLPDRATKARFLWFKGWNLRRLKGRTEMAIATLEQAQKYEDSHGSLTRNTYWMAKMQRELGKTDVATKMFQELADFSPFGIYGVLAQHELGGNFASLLTPPNTYNPRRASPIPDSIRVPIDWFIVLGEIEAGRRYWDSFPTRETWDASFSSEKKEAALETLSRLDQHIQVTVRLEEMSPEERKRLLLKRPEFMFPLPYESRIREEASRQGLDPALIYSIIRQESLFNPYARSHADAFGLMQLIPEMAAQAAKRVDLTLNSPDDLYDPDKNVALGTVFLKDLFTKYQDKFILSVCAYNANDKAIQGWVRTRMRPDPVEFIEEIPYDETRLYVKLVLRNFVIYQRRLSPTSVQFPEWTLRL